MYINTNANTIFPALKVHLKKLRTQEVIQGLAFLVTKISHFSKVHSVFDKVCTCTQFFRMVLKAFKLCFSTLIFI